MKVFVSDKRTRMLSAVVLLVLLVSLFAGCGQSGSPDINSQRTKTAGYFIENAPYGYGDEWVIIGLARSGEDVDSAVFDEYFDSVRGTVKSRKGVLSDDRYTEYARVAMGVRAIGEDPTDVEGYDILAPLNDTKKVVEQGWNGPAYALIAANTCEYILSNEKVYVDYLVDELKSIKKDEMVDMTAIMVQALSFYRDDPLIDELVSGAIKDMEEEFKANEDTFNTSESTSQVIIATTACGEDASIYLKDLFSYSDGALFKHVRDQDADRMATEQALLAMDAVSRNE